MISVNNLHLLNEYALRHLTEDGLSKVIFFNDVKLSNADWIISTEEGIVTSSTNGQLLKIFLLIVFIEGERVTSFNKVHSSNAFGSIELTEDGNTILRNDEHLVNAFLPIFLKLEFCSK